MLTTEEVPKRHIYSWKAHSVGGTQPCIGHPGRRVNSKAKDGRVEIINSSFPHTCSIIMQLSS